LLVGNGGGGGGRRAQLGGGPGPAGAFYEAAPRRARAQKAPPPRGEADCLWRQGGPGHRLHAYCLLGRGQQTRMRARLVEAISTFAPRMASRCALQARPKLLLVLTEVARIDR
jgi:hypothetical protein